MNYISINDRTGTDLEKATKVAIEDCLRLREDDKLVIITDNATYRIASELADVAGRITQEISQYLIEDKVRPLRYLPEEIKKSMGMATASIYVARGLREELDNFRYPLLDLVGEHKLRHAHMPDITPENLIYMLTKPEKIREFNDRLHEKLVNGVDIRIETDMGTQLNAQRGSGNEWERQDGVIKPGKWENLPGGEVFTYPVGVEGKVVIDGSLGQGFDERYGVLWCANRKTPLTFEIKNSRVVNGSVRCDDPNLERDFVHYIFGKDPYGNKVGELAFGTNPGVKSLVGKLFIDEKCLGTAHIALGRPPASEKVGWTWWAEKSKTHIDCVIREIDLYVDGKKLIQGGKWLI